MEKSMGRFHSKKSTFEIKAQRDKKEMDQLEEMLNRALNKGRKSKAYSEIRKA